MLIRDVNIHRREAEKQDADKSEGEKHEDVSKKPTEDAETKPTEASRPVRDTDEHKQDSTSPKPIGETPTTHKDESTHRDK